MRITGVRPPPRERAVGESRKQFYDRYINSAAWAETRRRFWAVTPRRCVRCGSGSDLHAHHQTYERLGDERLDDLVPLCEACHTLVHAYQRRYRCSLTAATRTVVAAPGVPPPPGRPARRRARRRPRTVVLPAPRSRPLTVAERDAQRREQRARHLRPSETGFVPRHLRGARLDAEQRIRVGPAGGHSRDSWQPP